MRETVVTAAARGEWEADGAWSDALEEDHLLARWQGRRVVAEGRRGPRCVSDGPVLMDTLEEEAEEESAEEEGGEESEGEDGERG